MPSPPIKTPANFVPTAAMAFADNAGNASIVSSANPLPIATTNALASASNPLVGTQSQSAQLGPYPAQTGRDVWLTLSGNWGGSVQVLRSTDAGVNRLPLTVAGQGWATFTANCNEQIVTETCAGTTYYLDIVLTSGSVTYRLAQ
jgi:hypothetical protein